MRNSSILGALLSLGMALSAHAQAPAGYLTLDAVEVETPATPDIARAAPPSPPSAAASDTPAVTAAAVFAPASAVSSSSVPVAVAPGGDQNLVSLKSALSALFSPPARPAETPAIAAPAVAQAPSPSPDAPAATPLAAGFESKVGESLRETLVAWSRKAGWSTVEWRLPGGLDFTLEISGTYPGDYMEATRAFIDALGCESELRVLFNPTTKVTRVEPT